MLLYAELYSIVLNASPDELESQTVPYLIELWLEEYGQRATASDIVETSHGRCAYLFDLTRQRLIAAWTVSHGAHKGARDKARMRWHPQGFGSRYHRGHAIPHSAGGPADINLIPQLGAINVGAFRALENAAVAAVGSMYFTHCLYLDGSQKPAEVEQAMLRAGWAPQITVHRN